MKEGLFIHGCAVTSDPVIRNKDKEGNAIITRPHSVCDPGRRATLGTMAY
jgi:hypothetical protein